VTNPEQQLNREQLAYYKQVCTEGNLAQSNVTEQIAVIKKLQAELPEASQATVVSKRSISHLADNPSATSSKKNS